jgi:tetratricopeptide (TPR) repeat protein
MARQARQAASHLRQAVTLSRESGDQAGEATALSNPAVADRRHGRYQQATSRQQQALALYRSAGDQWGATMALTRLGVVESQQAARHHRQAVPLFRRNDDPLGEAKALNGLGEAMATGQEDHARHHLREAFTIYNTLGAPEAEHLRAELHACQANSGTS